MGDNIQPSHLNDGKGVAVSPLKIKVNQFQKIADTDWSELPDGTTGYVNVAVGLNNSDVALYAMKQDKTIDSLKFSLTTIVDALKAIEPKLATALKDVYTFTCDGGNKINKTRKIKYYKLKEKDLYDAIVAAELQMREELGDEKINEHPFSRI